VDRPRAGGADHDGGYSVAVSSSCSNTQAEQRMRITHMGGAVMKASLLHGGLRVTPMPIRAAAMVAALSAAAMVPSALAQQAQTSAFSVGTATAQPGALATGAVVVPPGSDSGLSIPVAVIRGAHVGPVITFMAGTHGTEYASEVALQQLITRVDAQQLAGTVIIVPIVNIPSFETMTPHLNPVDHKSMAGGVGDPSGTQSPRTLAIMLQQIIVPADVVVDLHGGDLDENLRAYSYWNRTGHASQDSASLRLVRAFGMSTVLVTNANVDGPNSGHPYGGYALKNGKTLLVAEAGRTGTVAPTDVAALVNGSLNVLDALHMIKHPSTPVGQIRWLEGPGKTITADSAGMFFASVDRDTRVTAGQVVGYTTDFLGHKTGDVRAPIDGLVTYIRGVPSMWPKAVLFGVIPVMPGAPPPWHAPAVAAR
jgi:predicted deacylase